VGKSTRLARNALFEIGRTLPKLDEKRSTVRIVYRASALGETLKKQRLDAVKSLIEAAWQAKGRRYSLKVDIDSRK